LKELKVEGVERVTGLLLSFWWKPSAIRRIEVEEVGGVGMEIF